jgi:hypothetical protein
MITLIYLIFVILDARFAYHINHKNHTNYSSDKMPLRFLGLRQVTGGLRRQAQVQSTDRLGRPNGC